MNDFVRAAVEEKLAQETSTYEGYIRDNDRSLKQIDKEKESILIRQSAMNRASERIAYYRAFLDSGATKA